MSHHTNVERGIRVAATPTTMTRYFRPYGWIFWLVLLILLPLFGALTAAAQNLNWDQHIPTCDEMVESGFLTFEVGLDQANWFCADEISSGASISDPFIPEQAAQRVLAFVGTPEGVDSVSVSLRLRVDEALRLHMTVGNQNTSADAGHPDNINPVTGMPAHMDAFVWVAREVEGRSPEYEQLWSMRTGPHDQSWHQIAVAEADEAGYVRLRFVVHDPGRDSLSTRLSLAHAWVAYNPTRPVANEEVPRIQRYQIGPNPVRHQAAITGFQPGDQWRLYDVRGREVTSGQTDTVPTDRLAPGIHILRIEARSGLVEVHRITVVR